jgi:hypothetical protein
MRKRYNNDKFQFHMGDERKTRSVAESLLGVGYFFQAAALKHVRAFDFPSFNDDTLQCAGC